MAPLIRVQPIFSWAFQSGSSGTATVSGAGSTLNAYGVYVGYNGTGVLTVSNGGAVTATDFYVGGDSSNNGDGTVNIGAASGRAAVAPGQINAATLEFGSGDGHLVFNHTSQAYTFATRIIGDGDVTVEAGTTILSAVNTYTGDTLINGGTLLVNGSTNSSSLTVVHPGGTLGGTGTVGNVFVDDHATLAPGTTASIGTLTIDGLLMLCNCSTYAVKTGSAGSADRAVVTGVANLGGTLKVTPTTWIGATSTYTVLSSASGTTGNFDAASVTRPGLATLTRWNIVGNDVIVTLDRGILANALPGSASRNARSVADAIDRSLAAGATPSSQMIDLLGLPSEALTDATKQVSGEHAAGGQQAAYNASNQFMNVISDPFAFGRAPRRKSPRETGAPKPAPAGRSSLGAVSADAPRYVLARSALEFLGHGLRRQQQHERQQRGERHDEPHLRHCCRGRLHGSPATRCSASRSAAVASSFAVSDRSRQRRCRHGPDWFVRQTYDGRRLCLRRPLLHVSGRHHEPRVDGLGS